MTCLVIGAGPTGLTAALQLRALGVACRIVERRTAPSDLSRAIGIMPTSIKALTPLGAGDAIEREAMTLRKIAVSRRGQSLVQIEAPQNSRETLMGLPQNRTEEILRDALQDLGSAVEYGLAVNEVSTDEICAQIQFSDGTSAQYDWVIAADGVQSATRKQLGIAYPGFDLPGDWAIADVDVAGAFDPEKAQLDIQGDDNRLSMILPMEPRRARIVSSTSDALKGLPLAIDIAAIRRQATFQISVRQATSYQFGRVLLAGDAAHCHSPMGGKGMNLGIADAIAAAQAVASGDVDGYNAARHKVGKRVLNTTEMMRRMVLSNNWMAMGLAGGVGHLVSHLPMAQRWFLANLTRL